MSMADSTNDQEQKKTLSLSSKKLELKKTVDAGQIRQSFSHGRTKSVEFEVKKRRSLDQTTLAKERQEKLKGDLQSKTGLTQAELEERMRVLQQAQKDEETSAPQRAEEQKRMSEIDNKRAHEITSRQEELAQEVEERRQKAEKEAQEKVSPKKQRPADEVKSTTPQDIAAAQAAESKTKLVPKKAREGQTEVETEEAAKARKTLSLSKKDTKHKHHHFSIEDVLSEEDELGRPKSQAALRRAREKRREQMKGSTDTQQIIRDVIIPEVITVQELANRMAVRTGDVVKKLMTLGVIATATQNIDADTAELVVSEFGHHIIRVSEADVEEGLIPKDDPASFKKPRAPVVTIMGHVDHGKTSLLDTIRKTDVVASEHGGITQHIGAYQVTLPSGKQITFIDTPGHAAFSEMRARGANVTDIVILVVAADDGIKEQTVEAINHAKAAGVPIIVAINKMDKPGANPDRVRNELLQYELVVESLGGEIQTVEVSATQGLNIDKLEEAILLQAEMLELGANPNRSAIGAVIESSVDKGRGALATVLVQRGTLKVGDIFVAGSTWGRVRVLNDDKGRVLEKALPSMPVEVVGFADPPVPGDVFVVVEHEAQARDIAEYRERTSKDKKAVIARKTSLDLLMKGAPGANESTLSIIVKSDAQGSSEAILNSLQKIEGEEIAVRVLHTGVGAINESDVSLASATNAFIIGFNVRANNQARDLAAKENIEIRYYSIIYDVIDDVKKIVSGLMTPERRENILGYAEIRDVFNITKVGKVAGCYITSGEVRRGAKVRLLRDNVVVHEGALKTLKRFKDEVKEVKENYECGMAFENYNDIRPGDQIECFEVQEIARHVK
jgi:translation initiation factor IF-2